MDTSVLEIKSLAVAYGQKEIISDLSMRMERGGLTAVIGPNGAGKTTLIRAISGFVRPRSGQILVLGEDIRSILPQKRARLMAVVPQVHQLPFDVTVYQTILLGRTPYLNWLGSTGPVDHAYVHQAMEQVEISGLGERPIVDLSGGEQQRVFLARALAQRAPILLLDEPTTHLDLHHQTSLLNVLKRLTREENLAILMVVHDINLASLYADQVVLLDKGQIRAYGSPAEVITSQSISEIYGVSVNVIPHPQYGLPLVLPDGRDGE